MKHILHVVGARPNFMKLAPVYRALNGRARQTIVHTGQHYDAAMSTVFFEQLGIPAPDVNLQVGSGTHAAQTAHIMLAFEPQIVALKPDIVMVYGDVNSTMAAALVCSKLGVKIAHVEAGLRSRDRSMPEEINRMVTDTLADLLFTPSADGDANLIAEGVSPAKIHLVGNVMIDTLMRLLPLTDTEKARHSVGLNGHRFALVTLHRPGTVDDTATLVSVLDTLRQIGRNVPIVFPMHPRTRQRLTDAGYKVNGEFRLVEPLGYLEFLALQRDAAVVITDSGGIQEETTYLGVPCVTVRPNTERPVTVTIGTNVLVGHDMTRLCREVQRALSSDRKNGAIPPLWDGKASDRIADIIAEC